MTARRILWWLALPACLLTGCEEAPKPPVAPIAQSGELVVLTVNGPATYFEDAQGLPSGFEYDLAVMFAKELHAKPVFVFTDNPARIDKLLRTSRRTSPRPRSPSTSIFPEASHGARRISRRSTRSWGAPPMRRRGRSRSTTSRARASA
jgi:hypothetical protein